jgi:preprotein translocase subunit SecA
LQAIPSTAWRTLSKREGAGPLPKGLDASWNAVLGRIRRFALRPGRFLRRAARICDEERRFSDLVDAKLRDEAEGLRAVFRRGRDKPEDVDRAFAVVREVTRRKLGKRPYVVQVAGALAIEAGCVAEMATGEGKTLTVAMAAVVAGWRGRGCHLVTANDYLAERDAELMGTVYRFCGLTAGCITQATKAPDRLLQRGLECAIVDEADSVLIDEAVTPLLISGDGRGADELDDFRKASEITAELQQPFDYRVDHRYREAVLTDRGKVRQGELWRERGGTSSSGRRAEELVVQALNAREF